MHYILFTVIFGNYGELDQIDIKVYNQMRTVFRFISNDNVLFYVLVCYTIPM